MFNNQIYYLIIFNKHNLINFSESESTKLESILNAIDPMASASCSGYKQNEMTINYRRALSPIIEENEDDLTNTTFGLVENNSTRYIGNLYSYENFKSIKHCLLF